jgi:hypothetical protein
MRTQGPATCIGKFNRCARQGNLHRQGRIQYIKTKFDFDLLTLRVNWSVLWRHSWTLIHGCLEIHIGLADWEEMQGNHRLLWIGKDYGKEKIVCFYKIDLSGPVFNLIQRLAFHVQILRTDPDILCHVSIHQQKSMARTPARSKIPGGACTPWLMQVSSFSQSIAYLLYACRIANTWNMIFNTYLHARLTELGKKCKLDGYDFG